MAIKNGTDRIKLVREAMHREIDKLIDDVILNQRVLGFKVAFDCGVDRLLTMTLVTDTVITDKTGKPVHYTKCDIEKETNDEKIGGQNEGLDSADMR